VATGWWTVAYISRTGPPISVGRSSASDRPGFDSRRLDPIEHNTDRPAEIEGLPINLVANR